MPKFKIGDVVVCNRDINMYDSDVVFTKGTVKRVTNLWKDKVQIDGGNFGEYYEGYFDIYIEETLNNVPNGVDAKGNPKYFDESMLEDFMIVKLRNGDEGVISNQKYLQLKPPFVIYYYVGKGFDLARFYDGKYEDYIDIVEVFETKPYNCLKGSNAAGVKLIWKELSKETPQQKEVKELENTIKEATKKLEYLKGTL